MIHILRWFTFWSDSHFAVNYTIHSLLFMGFIRTSRRVSLKGDGNNFRTTGFAVVMLEAMVCTRTLKSSSKNKEFIWCNILIGWFSIEYKPVLENVMTIRPGLKLLLFCGFSIVRAFAHLVCLSCCCCVV